MNFLLDTNVVSEWVKPKPNSAVVNWLAQADEDRVFISVITLAELGHGVERLPASRRRNRLEQWLGHELPIRFAGRILPIDTYIAESWGRIVARCEAIGRSIGVMDAFLAATAEVHRLTLVTHDAADFQSAIKSIVNPWSE